MHTTVMIADIFYIDNGKETIRQCYHNTTHGYLELAKEMKRTHNVTKVFITEMMYDQETDANIRNMAYWYEPMGNTFVLTQQYEL